MTRAKQPVMVDDIEFDALISEEKTLEATIPEYAVEENFVVSDAILLNAEKLSLVLFVTETPVTWYERHGTGQDHVEEVCKKLEEMYYKHDVVTVTTSNATYTDMGIESITISRSTEIGYAREIPISFKKVRKTKAQTTTIPDSYGKSGQTGANAGTANTSSGTGSGSGSGSSNNPWGNDSNNTILSSLTGQGYVDQSTDTEFYDEYVRQNEEYNRSKQSAPTVSDANFAMDHVVSAELSNAIKDSPVGQLLDMISSY